MSTDYMLQNAYEAAGDDYPARGVQFEQHTTKTLISNPNRLPGTWVTAEGVVIQIADMKNSHLRNTIEMLRRTALKRLADLAAQEATNDAVRLNILRTLVEAGSRIGMMCDPCERALAAWGAVYDELLNEAMFRSDGDLNEWMSR